jgi:hypothetical protein
MEQQQHGFSDSTPRLGSDRLKKLAKSLLSTLQLMSISQISTQKFGSVHFELF